MVLVGLFTGMRLGEVLRLKHSSLGMLQKYSHTGLDNKKRAIQALTDHVLITSKKANLAIAQ